MFSDNFPLRHLSIIGVGLIGGSLARALRRAGFRGTITGCGRSEESLHRAVELGVIDRYALDPQEAVRGADGVVLAVPVLSLRAVLEAIAPALSRGCILTDVGSTKQSVVDAARAVFGTLPASFIPGHPIAGTERNGVDASFAELYDGRLVILTPEPESDPAAVATVRSLWQAAGAEVVEMTAQHHDEVLAETSHLPHLLAYALVDNLARKQESREIFRFAAGGFRDFTRIASSDPQMWRDICLANRDALLDALRSYQNDLATLGEALARADDDYLLQTFRRAKQARDERT